jgi:hypothetical protein
MLPPTNKKHDNKHGDYIHGGKKRSGPFGQDIHFFLFFCFPPPKKKGGGVGWERGADPGA